MDIFHYLFSFMRQSWVIRYFGEWGIATKYKLFDAKAITGSEYRTDVMCRSDIVGYDYDFCHISIVTA